MLQPGGRIVVVGMSKETEGGMITNVFEWTHQHFSNLLDCRPIFVQRSLEEAGFRTRRADRRTMWVPIEIVLCTKEDSSG